MHNSVSLEQEKTAAPSKASSRSRHATAWTPARRAQLEGYVALVAEALRLRDWTITVDWAKPCASSALAEISQMADSKHAELRLSPKLPGLPPRAASQVLVHELVHCHLFALHALAQSTVSAISTKEAAKVFDIAATSLVEESVDALADVVTAFLPELRLD